MADTADASLHDLVAASQQRIKELRRASDPIALLAGAEDVADEIARQVGKRRDEAGREALTAARRFTFNAAADCWPGWALSDKQPDAGVLVAARELAQRSAQLTKELGLGPLQEGTGVWLCGAFDLALGRYAEALKTLEVSRQHYLAAKAPGLVLLTEGYMAIVRQVAELPGSVGAEDLEKVIAKIDEGGFEDGAEWVEQLRTALKVFAPR